MATIDAMARQRQIVHRTGGKDAVRGADWAIAALAGRQQGVVSAAQLPGLGVTQRMIDRRITAGRLHRIHHGVYAVGHPNLGPEARWMAATLACGAGAVLSHRSAAALLGIRDSAGSRIEVSSPRRVGRSRAGILVHSGGSLTAADVVEIRGIPCTAVARTVIDLAAVLDRSGLEYAIHRAQLRPWSFDLGEVAALLDRCRGRRGTAQLRSLLGRPAGLSDSDAKSRLERAFLRLCREARLPMPRVNAWIPLSIPAGGLEVDFTWPDRKLAVETDSSSFHGTARARRNDPARDRALTLAGWRVARYTWWDVMVEPRRVAAEVRELLQLSS